MDLRVKGKGELLHQGQNIGGNFNGFIMALLVAFVPRKWGKPAYVCGGEFSVCGCVRVHVVTTPWGTLPSHKPLITKHKSATFWQRVHLVSHCEKQTLLLLCALFIVLGARAVTTALRALVGDFRNFVFYYYAMVVKIYS